MKELRCAKWGDNMVTFQDAYNMAKEYYDGYRLPGVFVAGETEKEWIFQTKMPEGDEDICPPPLIVDKETGEMRYGYPYLVRDYKAIYESTIIDLEKALSTDDL